MKKRTWLAMGYGSFQSAWRTLEGIETMDMIRKGRVRWVVKGDTRAQAQFINQLFGIAARKFSPMRHHSAPDLCSLKLRKGTLNRNTPNLSHAKLRDTE